jgi:hypothetical protein
MLILPTKQSRLRSLHSAAPAANVDSLTHRSDVLNSDGVYLFTRRTMLSVCNKLVKIP